MNFSIFSSYTDIHPKHVYGFNGFWKLGKISMLFLALLLSISINPAKVSAQQSEQDYYKMITVPIPKDIVLEVGGMELMPDGRLAVCTRRGQVWIIENPYQKNGKKPVYHLFAEGLHEPLGIAYRDGAFYINQREELTKVEDTDGDGMADHFETIHARQVSGNYHEYAYGPLMLPNGDMIVTYNLSWTGSHMESWADWGGWMVKISPDGTFEPLATGMRSPAGFGLYKNGDIFYAENQGGWVGSGFISHVEKGDFFGHPAGLKWTNNPKAPKKLKGLHFNDIPDTGRPKFEIAKQIPQLKTPSVWFPHGIFGISTSDILLDDNAGKFGPFDGQLLVGDQGQSKIMRVALEKVKGDYQGAVFLFREGFESGLIRLHWGQDHSLFVGQTSRGWASTGPKPYGLQRLVWTGKTPFEMKKVNAEPDGFKITFTKPVNKQSASNPGSYNVTSFSYKYHSTYGSPIIQQQPAKVTKARVSDDGMSVYLVVDGLREKYIHEIKASGVRDQDRHLLLHDTGYYTLKHIPEGPGLATGSSMNGTNSNSMHASSNSMDDKHVTHMPSSWQNGPDKVISINAITGMKFNKTDISVKAGSKIKLSFNNPTDLMHNLLIVKNGTLVQVAQKAMNMGLQGSEKGYVPESDNVLYHTSLLKPGSSESIYFTAPEKPGKYPYVCTFPGHYQTMQGVMTVTK